MYVRFRGQVLFQRVVFFSRKCEYRKLKFCVRPQCSKCPCYTFLLVRQPTCFRWVESKETCWTCVMVWGLAEWFIHSDQAIAFWWRGFQGLFANTFRSPLVCLQPRSMDRLPLSVRDMGAHGKNDKTWGWQEMGVKTGRLPAKTGMLTVMQDPVR